MQEKYDQKYEDRIVLLAAERVKNGKYKIFDYQARVITRERFPEFVDRGQSDNESCLVIINKEGETIVITQEFEHILRNALSAKE
jgi:hypothetical protein